MRIKLSRWAKENGFHYQSAWKMVKDGKFPEKFVKLNSGTILVEVEEKKNEENKRTFIYGRVSSYSKKDDLESQVKICEDFCISNGWQINEVFREIASGLNDNRKKLNEILLNPPDRLVILYKDRLTRFGFNIIEKLFKRAGCEIIVIHKDKEEESDLVKDLVAIITSFCCRLYGARRGQAKALKIKQELKND